MRHYSYLLIALCMLISISIAATKTTVKFGSHEKQFEDKYTLQNRLIDRHNLAVDDIDTAFTHINTIETATAGVSADTIYKTAVKAIRLRGRVNTLDTITSDSCSGRVTKTTTLKMNHTGFISTNTADASDTSGTALCGGGANSDARGSRIRTYGNENGSLPGVVDIAAGNVAGAFIGVYTGGNLKLKIVGDTTKIGFLKADSSYLTLTNYADSATAYAAGVRAGRLYHTNGTVKIMY